MNDQTVIRVEKLSKAYRLWSEPSARLKAPLLARSSNLLPRDSRLARSLRLRSQSYYRDFYALSNVDFEVKRGETVGIIGRNGSGKSTLLQLIAGTMEPTVGTVTTEGTIGALLELGSGFKPEFTGKENIFIHGAILGLTRNEVENRYDEIVSFADIGDFIDQPLQTYSSGMAVRLAFAVRAIMKPDILIVDEALAVGDLFFQAKCMRVMRELREGGCTILFVSHAMNAIKEFCERAILLHEGRVLADSRAAEAIQKYLAVTVSGSSPNPQAAQANDAEIPGLEAEPFPSAPILPDEAHTYGNPLLVNPVDLDKDLYAGKSEFEALAALDRVQSGRARFLNVQLIDAAGDLKTNFDFGEPVTYRMVIRVDKPLRNLWIAYHVRTKTGIDIIHGDSSLLGALDHSFKHGEIYVIDWGFELNLMHGDYFLSAALGIPDPPGATQPEWEYVDIINFACGFSMAPRKQGMIGGTAVWQNVLRINKLPDGRKTGNTSA